ncbi:MAG TPA: methyltransferase domain-containing protein [Ktedonobacteraceae bacterium]
MSMDNPLPGQAVYRLMEHIQVDLPSLIEQEHAQLALMGGPFPEKKNEFCSFTRVLDVACGTGSWAMEVARTNPHLEVIGISALPALIAHAGERASAAGLKNVSFLLVVGDEKPHLPFADAEFDLVNTQYLHSCLRTGEWQDFMRDCWRITRPGGYLRMTEPERGPSTSLAFERLIDLYLQAHHKAGQRFSPDDRHIGAANQLIYLCQEAGWTEIARRAYLMEYSSQKVAQETLPLYLPYYQQTFRPLIMKEGLASEEELTTLLQQIDEEIKREEFTMHRFLITVSGHKPPESEATPESQTIE